MNNLIEFALNLLYPKTCGMCDHLCNSYVCDYCHEYLEKNQKNILKEYDNKNFKYHFWIFEYKDEIREKIIDYKFNNKSYLYRTFLELILRNKIALNFISNYDILIPVPIHKKRLKARGYNQCELICKGIVQCIGDLEYGNSIIKKEKNIIAQSTLNQEERSVNILDAYALEDRKFSYDCEIYQGKKALIFDDVYTTGSTVNECAKLLKRLNFAEISVLTIAKD